MLTYIFHNSKLRLHKTKLIINNNFKKLQFFIFFWPIVDQNLMDSTISQKYLKKNK